MCRNQKKSGLYLTELNISESISDRFRMTFWQENYAFIKDVYDMRHNKMADWMENVEKVT